MLSQLLARNPQRQADPQVVALYSRREQSVRQDTYQTASALALVFVLAGVVLDWIVVPERASLFFLLRVASALGLAVVLSLLQRKPTGTLLRVLGHQVAFIPMVAILGMIVLAGPQNTSYYAGLNLVLIGASMLVRWPTRDSIISAFVCVVTYTIIAWYLYTPLQDGFRIWFNNSFFLFVTAVFSCAGTHLYNSLRFNEFLLLHQVESSKSEIIHAHSKLQALDEAKTRFFANVSHELRTPLTLILGPLEHLKSTPSISRDKQTRDLVDMLEDNGLRLLRLIDNLLDLVRLDSAAMPLRISRIPLENFVEGMAASLSATASLKGIQFDCKVTTKGQPDCYLDAHRLEKILLNLGMNAVKFTPRGGRISLLAEVHDQRVVFVVKDTGPGIKAADQALIFEPFWQADMSARRKHGGVGIGLALTKQLTESMSGIISLVTREGLGTTFRVDLPLRLSDTEEPTAAIPGRPADPENDDPVEALHAKAQLTGLNEDDQQTHESHRFSEEPALGPDGSARSRILVADDEPGLRRYLVTALSQHQVIEARDGIEAWELARQHMPDLILLDLMMPGMDGLEVAKKLQSQVSTSRIPIVLITANAEDAPRLEALRVGVSDFVTKPFSTIELRVRLGNLLKQKQFEKELSQSKAELEATHRELKENETRLVHAESLSALGRMSAGIIHEINNPLNYANTAMHLLRGYTKFLPEEEKEEHQDIMADLEDGIRRVIKIVSDLRAFTKGALAPFHEVDLSLALESARRLTSSSIGSTKLEWEVQENLKVWGSENQLVQVFVNIIENAASFVGEAKKRGEEPTLSVSAQRSAGGTTLITFMDNGCGVRPEDLGRVFEPFFTRRDVGSGMGMGLAICHQICQTHGATLEVHSDYGLWTQFTIAFPPPPPKTSESDDTD